MQYSNSQLKTSRIKDLLFRFAGQIITALILTLLLILIADLFIDGIERINWKFFISFPSRFPEKAGILSAWVGTFLVMFVTISAAIPLGIAAGIYLEEYASKNWITDLIEINITNLAGVPSIIYGLLALALFSASMKLGDSILTGGFALGLLILPMIIVSTREAIRSVPNQIREAAFALGSTKWQVVYSHILPPSMGGILTGIIIAISRAIGETAPLIAVGALTFIAFLPTSPVISTPPYISFQWLRDPFTVLPIQMFNWISRPDISFHKNAAASGIVLLAITLLINGTAIFVRYTFRKKIKW